MDWDKAALRLGAAAIGAAVLIRFLGGGVGLVSRALTSQEVTTALVYMETGRLVKPVTESVPPTTEQSQTETTTAQTEPVATEPTPTQPVALPVFGASDVGQVKINNACGYKANVKSLLKEKLTWNLKQEQPTVLIVHSHATEGYKGTSGYRSKSKSKNMVAVGEALKKQLEKAGIGVVHDKTLHDSPSYNDAYSNSRESVQKYLKEYPTIALVLDLHRDAIAGQDGKQGKVAIEVDGQSVAQLMLVVGTDASGTTHPNWEQNMALAVKIQAQLQRNTPGICRAISFRSHRFNQDLSPGALIVEVGAAGNTQKEALAATKLLGQAVIDLAGGTGS